MRIEGNIAVLKTREQKLLGRSTEGVLANVSRLPIDESLERVRDEVTALNAESFPDFWVAAGLALRSVKLQLDERKLQKMAGQVLVHETQLFVERQR
jgi:hypothetical protein